MSFKIKTAGIILLFLFSVLTCSAADINQDGAGWYEKVSKAVNYLSETYTSKFVKFHDLRISPVIRAEDWCETPMEISVLSSEDQIVQDIEKISNYQNGSDLLSIKSANYSVSAEKIAVTGNPYISISMGCSLTTGKKVPESFIKEINKVKRNILAGVLKVTTFTPQVNASGELLAKKSWITNLRIDSDNRIMFTGYAFDVKSVTALGKKLLKTGAIKEVALTNMTSNTYCKKPVWRFDFVAKGK